MYYLDQNSITKEVTYSEFEKYVTEGGVEKIVVYTNKNEAEAFIKNTISRSMGAIDQNMAIKSLPFSNDTEPVNTPSFCHWSILS